MSSHDDDSDEVVGYKKPPKKHQFKKGTSGNPSGGRRKPGTRTSRRHKAKDRDSIKKLAQKKIIILEGGKRKRVTTQEAIHQLLIRNACQGDKRSILAATRMFERQEEKERDEHRAFFRSVVEFKESAARDGRDSSSIPPHYPDHRDIEIYLNGDIEFTGPMNAEEAQAFDGMVVVRDALIEDYEEEVKWQKEAPDENSAADLSGMLASIQRCNESLPKRLRRMPPSVEAEALQQSPSERLEALLQQMQADKRTTARKKKKHRR